MWLSVVMYVLLPLVVWLLLSFPKVVVPLPYAPYQPHARSELSDQTWINLGVTTFALILPVFYAAARSYGVGLDVGMFYQEHWQRVIASNGRDVGYEFGFSWLMRIAYWLCGAKYGLSLVLLVCAALIIGCVYFVGKKMTPDVALLLFLTVSGALYLRGLSTMRQMVAVALGMCALSCAWHKQWCRYFLWLVLAYSFHRVTGILLAPLFLFTLVKCDWWYFCLWGEIVLGAGLFVRFDREIVYMFCQLIGNNYYYDYYIQGNFGMSGVTLMNMLDIFLNVGCFVAFFVYKLLRQYLWRRPANRIYDLFLSVYFCAVVVDVLSMISPQFHIYERMAVPFSWAGMFLIVLVLSDVPKRVPRCVLQSLVMVGALTYTVALVLYGNHFLLPYQWLS